MEPLALVVALFALLIVATRLPLVVAPEATVAVFERVLSTPGRVRLLGMLVASFGVALIVAARDAGGGSGIVIAFEVLGWAVAAAAIWLLALPRSYARLASSLLDAVSDPSALRVFGALGVTLGLLLGWLALFVL